MKRNDFFTPTPSEIIDELDDTISMDSKLYFDNENYEPESQTLQQYNMMDEIKGPLFEYDNPNPGRRSSIRSRRSSVGSRRIRYLFSSRSDDTLYIKLGSKEGIKIISEEFW
jgi:hypothetical protein